MARTGFFHHIGTFLLFASFILLLIPSISSPVINSISLLKVTLANHQDSVTFGSFGYCLRHPNSDDVCTPSEIGYKPAVVIEQLTNTDFSTASRDTSDSLTNALILHPIACGLAFIAFLLALGAGIIGSLFSAFVATLAWIITIIVMAIDFALFAIVKNRVNHHDGDGSHAKYGVAIWTTVAAMVCLFLGTVVVLVTCCSARLHRRRDGGKAGGPVRRRRFWQRRVV